MASAVYVVEGFRRWVRKQPLRELDLCRAVAEMSRGLIDADLGSGPVKKRIARSGAGKSGGFRALVATRRDGTSFFIDGYVKNALSNIHEKTRKTARDVARIFAAMNREQLAGHTLRAGIWKR